jgi:RimJ/RimL family protein N-acetyltransferase
MDQPHIRTSPRIETERLLLRWFQSTDLEAFFELGTDAQAIRYVGNVPFTSLDVARQTLFAAPLTDYATHGFGRFACVLKESERVIGFCGPKFLPDLQEVELGYRFLPRFWGKGLATESAAAAVDYARRDLQLHRLIALVHPENVASARVVAKLHFSLERKVLVDWLPDVEVDLYARRLHD